MLTLLYGTRRAREEIYRRIRRDTDGARRAYLIVPDQKALLAEGELAAVLPPRAALYVDAVGFSRLSNLVCRRYGGLTYNYANDGAKALSMYRAVEKLRPRSSPQRSPPSARSAPSSARRRSRRTRLPQRRTSCRPRRSRTSCATSRCCSPPTRRCCTSILPSRPTTSTRSATCLRHTTSLPAPPSTSIPLSASQSRR